MTADAFRVFSRRIVLLFAAFFSQLHLVAGAPAALIIQGLADWLGNYVILAVPDAVFVLVHTILPNMAYSLVLSTLIYLITKMIARLLAKRE